MNTLGPGIRQSKYTIAWISVLVLACWPLLAQPHSAVSGYIFDPGKRVIRAVVGIPGAAELGAPIALGGISVERAVVRGNRALVAADPASDSPAQTTSGGRPGPRVYFIPQLAEPQPVEVATEVSPEHIFADASGELFVIYSASSGEMQFLNLAHRSEPLTFPLSVTGTVTAAAVSAGSRCIALATLEAAEAAPADDAEGQAVITLLCAEHPQPVPLWRARGSEIRSLAFSPDGEQLYLADTGRGEILHLADLRTGGAPALIELPESASKQFTALLVSASALLVADAGGSSLWIVDLEQNIPARNLVLPVRPERLDPLGDGAAIALSAPGESPLVVVDPARDWKPFFIPESE